MQEMMRAAQTTPIQSFGGTQLQESPSPTLLPEILQLAEAYRADQARRGLRTSHRDSSANGSSPTVDVGGGEFAHAEPA